MPTAVAVAWVVAWVEASVEELIEKALEGLPETCHIVIMSNGGFGGIHRKLVAELEKRRG